MCLPTKTDQPSSSSRLRRRSILGHRRADAARLPRRPVLAGALGGLGAGVLLGAGGVMFALALCAAVPAVVVALRRAPPADADARVLRRRCRSS